MTRFEPRTSGFGSNWATTTADELGIYLGTDLNASASDR